jgi:hypothetical protein
MLVVEHTRAINRLLLCNYQ